MPVTNGFLAGEEDWVSPVKTGMRDWALVSRDVGLDSIKKIKEHYYSKGNIITDNIHELMHPTCTLKRL